MVKETIPDKVLGYLEGKPAMRKASICRELDLKKSSVDRACRLLRKEKKVGMYMRLYWGIL